MENLDILFIQPNTSEKIYQDLYKTQAAIEPPIWAAMLNNQFQIEGYKTELVDFEALRYTAIKINGILENDFNPKIIALIIYGQNPSASTQNMVGAEEIYKCISQLNKDIKVLFIGPHPSAMAERTVRDNSGAMACKGEGLETLKGLLENKGYEEIPGLVYLKDNIVYDNGFSKVTANLDTNLVGVNWNKLDIKQYRTANWHALTNNNERSPFVSIYTSLGCPFHCSFCMINAPFGGSSFRYWSPEHIIKQFDWAANNNIKNIKIADEMFVLYPKHFLELCKLIIAKEYDFNIWAYARIDTVKDEYLETLRKAGVNWLALGIESGNPIVRKEVIKGKFTEVNILDICTKIRDHGINIVGNYIFGLPMDTIETMQETYNLSCDINAEYTNYYCTMAYPGSKLHENAVAKDPSILPEYPGNPGWAGYSQFGYETFNMPTDTLTRTEIVKFRDKAFSSFYAREEHKLLIAKKFGTKGTEDINNMLSYKLKRKYSE